jgi:hypothetical protein
MSNEKNISTIANEFQTTSQNFHSKHFPPLKSAIIYLSQLRLMLLRSRSEVLDCNRRECLNRLLQAIDRIGSSLEWLRQGLPSKDFPQAVSPRMWTARHVKELIPEVLRELEAQRSRTAEIDLQCAGGAQ